MSILSSALAALSLWTGGVRPLNWPKPMPVKCASPAPPVASFPDLLNNDGSYFLYNATTLSLLRYNSANTLVWTLAPTELNASCTGILAVFPDYANSRIYVFGTNGGTTTYFGFTTITAKSYTHRGTSTITASGPYFMDRRSDGNFQVYGVNNGNMVQQTLTESTGAIGAQTPFTLGGMATNILQNVSLFANGALSFYMTADATALFSLTAYPSHVTTSAYHSGGEIVLNICRGGNRRAIGISATNLGGLTGLMESSTTAGFALGAQPNGPQVSLVSGGLISGSITPIPRDFDRAEFDAFIYRCADMMGLPR
ncbi:hypothetical protein [Aquidulcibacter sp.]|uniref:hypothetical protein n=1 Tax=Aquidulcibacter sp. TaxID=2052990 RepID=UPI0025C1ACDE|nr:hypothetical protein [Aquidulcibacter sp.]MCA3694245.1 hypothetical protein [Aquidulcibacter sp.]